MRKISLFVLSAAVVAACSPTMIPGADAGPDARADSASDARADATMMEASADVIARDASDASSQPDADAAIMEAAVDAGSDSAADARADSAPDASPDSAADASPDSAPDAAPDAAADAAMMDAAPDAAAPDAAGSDAAPDASGGDSGAMTTPRTLWMVRVGDGVAALSAAASAAFIERRSSVDGAMAGATIALPTAMSGAQHPVVLAGNSTTEGALTRSANGRFVTMGGYSAAVGTATITGTAAPATLRVVARIAADGTIDSSTTLDAAFSAGNIRGAASVDGTAFWAFGSVSGLQYQTFGTTAAPVQVLATPANLRVAGVFAGQLYATSGSANYTTAFAVGTGTPTMVGATANIGMGLTITSAGPNGLALFDLDPMVAGLDTLYLADDRATSSGGGIQRWTFNGTTWTLAATITGGLTAGVRALTAWADGAAVTLVTVTTENPSRVISYVDQPGIPPTAPNVIATAPTNTQYRGVAIAPTM